MPRNIVRITCIIIFLFSLAALGAESPEMTLMDLFYNSVLAIFAMLGAVAFFGMTFLKKSDFCQDNTIFEGKNT